MVDGSVTSLDQSDLFAFDVTADQLQSVASGKVWIRVVIAGTDESFQPAMPLVHGAERIHPPTDLVQDDAYQVTALFELIGPGSYLLEIGATATGAYQIELSVAGDINADGRVDGFDSQTPAERTCRRL